jgi:hypothetical protein
VTQFEYAVIQRTEGVVNAQAELNEFGLDGWELVAVTDDGSAWRYYFKRQK